jgi:hypothetical protein
MSLCIATVLDIGGAPVAARGQSAQSARSAQSTRSAPSTLQPAAILTVISGEVLARSGNADLAPATDGAVLYVGSTVRTGADARAVITLFEGSTVELEPASDITIEEATTRAGSTIVQLAQSLGRSWHVVTHLTTADSRYEVKTPAATASVRGTAFEVAVEDGAAGPTTTVTTTEGRVATIDAGATAEVLVTPGLTTTVSANAAPETPRAAPAAQRVVTVAAVSDGSLVVDPLGRANGIKDGRVLAQTPGASVRMEDGTIVVTLPNVPDGVFATTVAASSGAPIAVSTTVADAGEDPVTVTSAVSTGSGPATSAVDVRAGGDKPEVRVLTGDESKNLPGPRIGAKPQTAPPSGTATQPPSPADVAPLVTAAPPKKNDDTPQPAPTVRRTFPPTPTPVKR